jgi:hypothetical protein
MSDPITDYSSEQRKYVPEQYKRSTRLLGVIDAALGFSDELEKALREISDNFNIEDAVGPMLDYFGLYFGITRKIGETDEQLRMRIRLGSGTDDLPTNEAIYNYFRIALGITDMMLCPVWPAGLYFILGAGFTQPIEDVTSIAAASGVDLGQGTFLCLEDGEEYGLLVLEDNGQPLIVDQRWPDTLYELVDDEGNFIVDENGNHIAVLDFLTTT